MGIPGLYVPADAKPWRLAMGLRPLSVERWLEVDQARAAELSQKHRLLAEEHRRVVAAQPGSEAASAEVAGAVVEFLETFHPGLIEVEPGGVIRDLQTGLVADPAGVHPVDFAGRIVQEDLCVMESRSGKWILTAASVCFPSRWALAAKIGCDLRAIHAPVPGYEEHLAGPTDRFFDRITPERGMWRLNWSILDRPDLHQPDPGERRGHRLEGDPGERVFFRVERQTLRRLSDRPAVAFTIRTYVSPLAELVHSFPETVEVLSAALRSVPAATVEYKGWAGIVDPVISWLDQRRAEIEPTEARPSPPRTFD